MHGRAPGSPAEVAWREAQAANLLAIQAEHAAGLPKLLRARAPPGARILTGHQAGRVPKVGPGQPRFLISQGRHRALASSSHGGCVDRAHVLSTATGRGGGRRTRERCQLWAPRGLVRIGPATVVVYRLSWTCWRARRSFSSCSLDVFWLSFVPWYRVLQAGRRDLQRGELHVHDCETTHVGISTHPCFL